MKILLVHNRYLLPGGEDEVFEAERELLRLQGQEVVEHIEDNRSIKRKGKAKTAIRALWSHPTERLLRQLLQNHRPDIAHFHNIFPLISPAAYYACRSAGTPVVQTLHNYRLLCVGANFFREARICEKCLGRRLTWPGMLHRCYHGSLAQSTVVSAMLGLHRQLKTWERKVDLFIAVSDFARRKLIQGGLPPARIVVKPNFVEPDPGAAAGTGGYVLFAGRLSEEKGVAALLKAWRRLPHIPLYIAGDGPLLQQVSEFAASAAGEIRVLGRCGRAELFELMKSARYLVFPSQCYETFAMVVAESFACGRPVVASNLGATAEIVEHGRTGLLFRPGESEDLADKAAWLWAQTGVRERMGREARAEFKAEYSAQSNYLRLMEIYRIALEGRSRRKLA